jgi:lactoylglutathione lyase
MKYVWTTIMVKNMEESLNFYQEVLGLQLNRRFSPNPTMDLAFLGEGDAEVELICDSTISEPAFGKDISMGFMSKVSLDETIDMLKTRGINVIAGPFQPNPAMRFLYILDPNGVKIQLIEDMR